MAKIAAANGATAISINGLRLICSLHWAKNVSLFPLRTRFLQAKSGARKSHEKTGKSNEQRRQHSYSKMGEIVRSKSRIASDWKMRDSWPQIPLRCELRFETRDWRFVVQQFNALNLRKQLRFESAIGKTGRLIFIHLQCWEVLPFCRFQRQRCIKISVLRAQDFYTPLALKMAKGQHLPALEVSPKNR